MSDSPKSASSDSTRISRRAALTAAAGAAAISLTGDSADGQIRRRRRVVEGGKVVVNGRIKQSIVSWCFDKYWKPERMAQIAKQLGCPSIELIDPKDWPTLKKYDLTCAIASSHGFVTGMNHPQHHEMCVKKLRAQIDACADFGVRNVISFTGMREDISDEQGLKNCVAGYKKVIGYAEKKGVDICLEMLNSRVDKTMKGHPGYQGDHTDYCVEIIRKVGSERMKLLFDIYHVQIMDGDIIQRIRQYKDLIGHYHTAGNPGRKELDDSQEINYKAIMEEIVRTGYKGFVGQEFIPTRDPLQGLREAVRLCDV